LQICRVGVIVPGLPHARILTSQLFVHQIGQFSVNMYSKIHWYIFSSFHKSAQVEVIFSSILLLNITLSSQKSFMMLSEFFISIPVKLSLFNSCKGLFIFAQEFHNSTHNSFPNVLGILFSY